MHFQTASPSLALLISAGIPLAAAAGPSLTDDASCGCYLTNGTESQFFSHHTFWDFRSQSQYAGVPPVVTSAENSGGAPRTSKFFTSAKFDDAWIVGNWNNSKGQRKDATIYMTNSPNNVYIEANSEKGSKPETWLTLRTQRLETFQTAAELESKHKNRFVSVRMLARTIGAPGAITALFTYKHSDRLAEVQESDLEVRTLGPDNIIHYTNQPSYTENGTTNPLATTNATLPDGLKWTDWAVHRLDWTPERSTWFVNGKQMAQISYQTPRDDSKVTFNAWSDGSKWSGNMSVTDAAYLQIQWFELVFNSTDPLGRADPPGVCHRVCSIDETPNQGQPVMLWNNAAARSVGRSVFASWIPLVVVLGMFAWR
ncbi:concanavalin A-like lectin/glucanase domain-containing protein [Cercophora newfieldiana]|uniref:Concanavalin A-like lectin/glucanase domain-containing protein n=1 Tax=Cercophora newfieldiana TaxID=92897 RepID=A0AA39Y747_9PEZI|nr:concanavalin A-like lectin/glucanase domain-containing protein [Cercophora newfieldiana]